MNPNQFCKDSLYAFGWAMSPNQIFQNIVVKQGLQRHYSLFNEEA